MFRSGYKPLPGRLLVSEPFMGDTNFTRSVVLLVEHNEDGSLGFVLNRKIESTLNELLDELPYCHNEVHLGGPVAHNTLHYIHRLGARISGSNHIVDDIFWGGKFEELEILLKSGAVPEDEIAFFVGYSGWAPGQLDRELEQGSWIVSPAEATDLLPPNPDLLWQKVLRNLGRRYKVAANYPVDPRLN